MNFSISILLIYLRFWSNCCTFLRLFVLHSTINWWVKLTSVKSWNYFHYIFLAFWFSHCFAVISCQRKEHHLPPPTTTSAVWRSAVTIVIWTWTDCSSTESTNLLTLHHCLVNVTSAILVRSFIPIWIDIIGGLAWALKCYIMMMIVIDMIWSWHDI